MPPKIEPGMDPIQPAYRENMQAVMTGLTKIFPNVGIALFIFGEDKETGGQRANYISNGRREDVMEAMKEWIARNGG